MDGGREAGLSSGWMRKRQWLWTERAPRLALSISLVVAVLSRGCSSAPAPRAGRGAAPGTCPTRVSGRGPVLGPLRLRGGADAGDGGPPGGMWIMVHGEESDAVTLAWEKIDGAQCYEIQLKSGDADFVTVSDKLTSTMVCRKRCSAPPACPRSHATHACARLQARVPLGIAVPFCTCVSLNRLVGVWRGAGPQKEPAAGLGAPGASPREDRRDLGRL